VKYPMHLRGKGRNLYGRSNGFLAVLLLAAASFGCTEENTAPIASPPLLETGADLVINGLEHLITLEGVKEGLLFAERAFFYRDSSIYQLEKPDLILYTATGVQRAQVTSETGRFNPNTREMLAMGGVVLVITEGNKRVESEQLHYDPSGDRIWSDSATSLVEPGRVTEGLGFESDLNFRRTWVGPGSIRNTGGGGGPQG
jgi:LPS export ABC transporter protein LptC